MSEGVFTRRVEEMRQRVATLRQLPEKSPLQQQAFLTEALEKLETALEELEVAEEELVAVHEEVEVERRRYQELFDFAPDGYLVTDREGTIREANRAAAMLLNVSHQFLVGKSLLVFIDSEERHAFYSQLSRLSQRGLVHQLPWEDPLERQEWELRLRPGQSYQRVGLPFEASLTAAPVRSSDGHLVALRWLIRDITKHRQIEVQLRHNAFHDALTGLPNRDLFMDRLGQAVEHAKRHKDYWFAVLFLDLDRFKMINDNFGHILGDQFLITTARRLEACLRPADTAARLGGDEFTVLLDDIKDVSDAIQVAQRIQDQLTLPFNLKAAPTSILKEVPGRRPSTEDLTSERPNPEADPYEVFTSASIGIAFSARSYHRPEDLLRDADIAMYRAKELGKARCEVFNPDMYSDAIGRLQLENDLRRAMERQEFRIHYQPIVTLETGMIAGFEALVRWQRSPGGDLTYPAEFMPAARETGLSIAIDRWVFIEACRQFQPWQAEALAGLAGTDSQRRYPGLTLSVNLCSRHFIQPDLIQYIEQVLQETGLEAHSLKLEITESVLIENTDAATNTLLQLQALGVQVCLDDFGTGYSSLSYLHHFPINTLKIDRSFISNITAKDRNLEIVGVIVKLAKTLSMDVVAEGVETAEQLVQLRELKCEAAQGYYFSQPLDSEAAAAFVKENLLKTTNQHNGIGIDNT